MSYIQFLICDTQANVQSNQLPEEVGISGITNQQLTPDTDERQIEDGAAVQPVSYC